MHRVIWGFPRKEFFNSLLIEINPVDFQIPGRLTFWRTPILFLDDLDKYLEKQNMIYLIQEFIQARVLIVATCRDGFELQKVEHLLEQQIVLFAEQVRIPKIDPELGSRIAQQLGQKLPASFDGNVGSILLRLDAMRDRFRQADPVEQGILRAIKRLYLAGIYKGREIFSMARIQEVCRHLEGLKRQPYEWRNACEHLRDRGFVEFDGEEALKAKDAYLELVVDAKFQQASVKSHN